MYGAKKFDIVSRRKMPGLPNTIQWLLVDMLSNRSRIMIIIIKERTLQFLETEIL